MLLSEEQILIRDAARVFAQEQVAPQARVWEAAGEIPRALLAEMGPLGFMGMCVPAEWGGVGTELVSHLPAPDESWPADSRPSTVVTVNKTPGPASLPGS